MTEFIKQIILPASLQGEIETRPDDADSIAHNDRIVNIKMLETAAFALPAILEVIALASIKEVAEVLPNIKALALVLMCTAPGFAALAFAQIVDLCYFHAKFETSHRLL